ncbi:MAG: ATP-binding cassette domain-containing protein [Crenarchaeota archaeon]|nr:ATP-binding cassette domain-containing protein [Thermoproteota archaeon]
MSLVVENLHVESGGREILRGINLELSRGEVHVVLGPNGAGKSTLLYTIAGIPRYLVKKGRIVFEDEDVTNLPTFERVRRGMCLMHQFQPQFKTVKVQDLERMLISKFGGNELALKARDTLDIESLRGRYLFTNMSGGERKRLELYLTLLTNPRLVLLDEPDSGVDVDSLVKIGEVINMIIDSSLSCILVTHRGDIVNMLKRIDRVHVMCSGRIVESDGKEMLEKVLRSGFRRVCEKLRERFD